MYQEFFNISGKRGKHINTHLITKCMGEDGGKRPRQSKPVLKKKTIYIYYVYYSYYFAVAAVSIIIILGSL